MSGWGTAAYVRRALAALLTRAAPCDRAPGTADHDNVSSSRPRNGAEKEKTA
ncbi:hypothetical protein [Streptomyces sp. UNOC14_S4]|uniref:hypothetical protein n=1 Tax=Streptomyces sp. UNOC14_S4 TaxID=2872340 RepID=UPI001E28F7D5|nr:hypothetical protein [Streptomyces sp. UNOC14_S4]MCC3770252.1 hypothetical protein [Streptomyces sp. UNOC14_S4]